MNLLELADGFLTKIKKRSSPVGISRPTHSGVIRADAVFQSVDDLIADAAAYWPLSRA